MASPFLPWVFPVDRGGVGHPDRGGGRKAPGDFSHGLPESAQSFFDHFIAESKPVRNKAEAHPGRHIHGEARSAVTAPVEDRRCGRRNPGLSSRNQDPADTNLEYRVLRLALLPARFFDDSPTVEAAAVKLYAYRLLRFDTGQVSRAADSVRCRVPAATKDIDIGGVIAYLG